ncbi:DUF2752 domain-containing protein [Streptomonospora wellingtoniae]|uniref:DUF2752 domain-containing protein n=1 Tax=Streptomonospora wellingtoniae TaxID=3075544 RepID=A0ABU2KNL8_9ACTN|nr:DUF2752 domain-containing protein [Streptomonospora sp. DSM 45055]MDT0300843.1 DUF2752 domain-containing protein [Streptomonospora sp. DSM 45055]
MSDSERGIGASVPAWALPVRMRVETHDGHRWVLYVAVGGLLAGAAMAVFGLPPVELHSPLHYMGVMMPTCGATRAVWAAMSGDLAMSLRYNPLGIVLVAGAFATLLRLAAGLVTGRWVNVRVVSWPAAAVVATVLVIALEVNQQLNRDLLQTSAEDATPLATMAVYAVGAALAAVVAVVSTRSGRAARGAGRASAR